MYCVRTNKITYEKDDKQHRNHPICEHDIEGNSNADS